MKTKEHLLNQGIKLFTECGYNNTSIDDITKACNITKGAFYYHFKTKDEIFTTAMFVVANEIKNWMEEKTGNAESIEELIQNLFDYSDYFSYSKYYDNINSNIYFILMDAIKRFPQFKAHVASSIYSNMPLMEEKIREAQKNKIVKDEINPQNLALHISILLEGLMFVSAITGTESMLIDNGKKLADNILAMIMVA